MLNETETTEIRFADAEESEVVQYQAVSKAALIAVVLGFASLLALAHWLLCLIPIVTVIIALFAMRSIARSDSLVGRKAALFAIALAMFMMGWSISRDISRRHTINSEAEQNARSWLGLVISAKDDLSKLYEAFELHRPPVSRLPKGANLREELGTLDSTSIKADDEFTDAELFRDLYKSDVMKTIIQIGADAKVQFDGTLRSEKANVEVIWQQFTITYPDKSGVQQQLAVVLEMRRQFDESNSAGVWWMADIRTLDSFVK